MKKYETWEEALDRKLSANCQNCIHHKVDDNGNSYCDEYNNTIDFINIYCGGNDFEEAGEEE